MKYDILLCGVGGQGILSVAHVMDNSAMEAGYFLKQPEVHGMSQRGGAVQAHVRVSDAPIASDLIPTGDAQLILSLEPLESLRYLPFLSPEDGWLITDITPFVNVADYPEPASIYKVLLQLPAVLLVNGAHLARKAGSPKAQNIVVLGCALGQLPYPPEVLEKHVAALFARKSDRLVHINLNAFRMGRAAGEFHAALCRAGISAATASRVLPWLDFQPWPVPEPVPAAWVSLINGRRSEEILLQLWSAGVTLPVDEETPARLLNGISPQEIVRTRGEN